MSSRLCVLGAFASAVGSFLALGCNDTAVEVTLRSLQASGEVAFVCRASDGTGADRSLCPDYEESRHKLFALVTQTATEEVAVIDTAEAKVVDLDPATPGYSFLRLASRPGDIAATPGGAATIVGLTGVGKTGLAALPTTCLGRPAAGEPARDVTSFPACHLPSVPGDITVLVEPPATDGTVQQSCDATLGPEDTAPAGATRSECPANVVLEPGPVGRRKILVALPDRGELAVVDAQWLVDREPGTFEECRIETTLALGVDLGPAGVKQETPPDLEAPGCTIEQPTPAPVPPSYSSRPAGFARSGSRLYVGDHDAPVVHVLDVSSPCGPVELPPLLPMSFEDPSRVVTTSRVAASPLTPSGKQFVYAVDQHDPRTPSVMIFDVSPGVTDRTPLVRPGGSRILEPPDRIRLSAPVADIAFALRDLPLADPSTGVAESGVLCDPNPEHPSDSAGAQHRPSSDKTRGAQPRLLRGLFGLAMLTSGQIAVIDVDDFDAPCRRPITTEASANENFRGCANDVDLPEFLTLDPPGTGTPTVTNEVSCNMVEPHRVRAAVLGVSSPSDGVGAPSLVALPQFATPDGVELAPASQPHLLAVDFPPADPGGEPVPPEVYVATTLLKKGRAGADLPTDPNQLSPATLTLPFLEPRAYPANDAASLVYEGRITVDFPSGVIQPELEAATFSLRVDDPVVSFCDQGVYDQAMMSDYGVEELGIPNDAEARERFAESHSDLVEITGSLLPATDSYWVSLVDPALADKECQSAAIRYGECVDTFGVDVGQEISPNRELTVVEAYQNTLGVEPRGALTDAERARMTLLLGCCFPDGVRYHVRAGKQWVLRQAGGLRHDVVARRITNSDGTTAFRCERDCNPLKLYARSRVFEIASSESCLGAEGQPICSVGPVLPEDPCSYDPRPGSGRADGGITLDEPAAACIHAGLTSRFAVYRGLLPSVRDMAFTWQTSGGFRSLVSSLTSVSVAVLPQHVEYLPEIQAIAIVDGASLGLSIVSLDTLRIDKPWPVY